MSKRTIVIIGLPESGKTTYLAALWHLITARDVALCHHEARPSPLAEPLVERRSLCVDDPLIGPMADAGADAE